MKILDIHDSGNVLVEAASGTRFRVPNSDVSYALPSVAVQSATGPAQSVVATTEVVPTPAAVDPLG